jgi:hypothetical protein
MAPTISKETAVEDDEVRPTIIRDEAVNKKPIIVQAGGGRGGRYSNEVTKVLKDAFKEDNKCSEERAALLSAEIPLKPAKIVTYFNNLRTREKTAARKRIQTLHAAARDQYCGQLWTHIPAFLLAQVMDQLPAEGAQCPSVLFGPCGWGPEASAVMRRVCKGWQEIHDRLLSTMRVKLKHTVSIPRRAIPYEPNEWRKFTGLKALQIHTYFVTPEQLGALASLTGLTTLSLNVSTSNVTAKGLLALAPLTALSTLQLNGQVTQHLSGCLRALASLNALTSLNLGNYILTDEALMTLAPLTGLTSLHLFQCAGDDVTAEGLQALAPLTGLTDLDLFSWYGPDAVTDESLRATLAPLTGLTRLNLEGCEKESVSTQGLAAAVAPLTRLTTLLPPAREYFSTGSEDDSFDDDSFDDDSDDTAEEFTRNNGSFHGVVGPFYDDDDSSYDTDDS